MLDSAQALVDEHAALERQMGDPAIASDPDRSRELGKRYAALGPTVAAHHAWVSARDDLGAARELAAEDPAFASEIPALEATLATAEDRLRRLLIPRDPDDDRDVILEVKAGEGGEESALFAGDLLRMYLRHAERRGWRIEVLDATESDLGGYKDVRVSVKARGNPQPGEAPWARLKFEGGVHRVQRVPVTESQGRIHTSAAGVWVMPEAEDVEVDDRPARPAHRRLPLQRPRWPERQHHRLRGAHHAPAHRRGRLLPEREEPAAEPRGRHARAARPAAPDGDGRAARGRRLGRANSQVRTVDRSERIRTYNYPENRISDHRTGFKAYNLDTVLDGDLDPVIQSCVDADEAARLAAIADR